MIFEVRKSISLNFTPLITQKLLTKSLGFVHRVEAIIPHLDIPSAWMVEPAVVQLVVQSVVHLVLQLVLELEARRRLVS